MNLTPREKDKLLVAVAAMVAARRLERGVRLNYPEAVALISDYVLEGARDGRTVAELMRDGATVLTRAHFEVSMLGVRMYREDSESTERWQRNRLVSFHRVSDKGDGRAEVKGEARGDNFVITSPRGTVTAPAAVQPANPWSANFLGSNTIMHPDTGRVEQVRVSGGEQTTVKIDGASISARKYDVDGKPRYSVWLDARGVPMMFAIDDDSGKITFTLSKCVRCGLTDLSQMGLRAH